jgi:hypothetical protein
MDLEEEEDKFITEEERAENAEEFENLTKQMQDHLRIKSAEALAGSFHDHRTGRNNLLYQYKAARRKAQLAAIEKYNAEIDATVPGTDKLTEDNGEYYEEYVRSQQQAYNKADYFMEEFPVYPEPYSAPNSNYFQFSVTGHDQVYYTHTCISIVVCLYYQIIYIASYYNIFIFI